ncbi:MAG: hypothetical protein HY789_08335 [Deltaproteobacteria bacterium]|nr:hypothetical protein [Deltaproteobacteria bacterium]
MAFLQRFADESLCFYPGDELVGLNKLISGNMAVLGLGFGLLVRAVFVTGFPLTAATGTAPMWPTQIAFVIEKSVWRSIDTVAGQARRMIAR